jgi:hypothetical protein
MRLPYGRCVRCGLSESLLALEDAHFDEETSVKDLAGVPTGLSNEDEPADAVGTNRKPLITYA